MTNASKISNSSPVKILKFNSELYLALKIIISCLYMVYRIKNTILIGHGLWTKTRCISQIIQALPSKYTNKILLTDIHTTK